MELDNQWKIRETENQKETEKKKENKFDFKEESDSVENGKESSFVTNKQRKGKKTEDEVKQDNKEANVPLVI